MSMQGKVWGETTEFFKNDCTSGHYLKIKAGGYCSEHRHNKKSNLFFLITGSLEIKIWRERNQIDTTILGPGQMSEVPPGVYHKFTALEDFECIEI